MVVVAADHGEALGDHGEDTHGVFLYDATIHVPLVVRLPGRRSAGTRVGARVRLADIAPTILEAAALPVPSAMQGESLVRLKPDATATGAPASVVSGFSRTDDRPVYSETDYSRQAFGWSPLASWRADRFLFVRAPRRELYDEIADPQATRNIADARARVADGIDAELRQFLQRGAKATDPSARRTIDPALAERLAALGYVAGSSASPPAAGAPGIDPKDRIQIANALHGAVLAVEDGAFQKAIPLLEKVTASDPGIHIAQLNLGVARARQKQYARAIGPLKKAIALQPEVMIAHYELALALYETGELKTAASHLQIVASRMPKWADARYSLASVDARIDRIDEATTELRAALALEPRHFRANLLLGRIFTLQGQAAAAVGFLQTATSVQPSSAEAYQFLADAYEKSGRAADAAAARQRAAALKK
jgi:tetratricopeptide (TPR) repeat protein